MEAATPPGSLVFISHSSRDADAAQSIVAVLESSGVPCWIAPRNIAAGIDYNHAIMTGINACSAMVLVCSRHSVDSDPVRREVERAVARRVPVIPVWLEQVPLTPALEYLISTVQWVTAHPPPLERHLDSIVSAVRGTLAMPPADRSPAASGTQYIGPYRLLEPPLGEGGMGTVYKAEQRTPVKRTVALKLIKAGFDTKEVIARFESERQALARMDHPHIAKVFDAGADSRGRPYFAMEYVPGKPITQFADDNKLIIKQRLELFMQVCDAISHAHTKAIIHRDIKASNVLAFMQDGKPCAKVIDFGIAKALTGDRLTDRTFNTDRGAAIGTYESMSPEQADGSPDIDTRTDVYSLGVLLYELLSGAKPFDAATLREAADNEARRIIREVEAPRPSTRLSSLGVGATVVAAARQSQIEALSRQLRNELEWIPLKALRKERERRYASPLQLAEDIQNYLDGKPLIAGPESAAYRLKKFLIRNKKPVITSAVAFVVIAVSVLTAFLVVRTSEHKAIVSERRAVTLSAELANALNVKDDALHAAVGARENEKRSREQATNQAAKNGQLAADLRHTLSETDARIGHLLLEQARDGEALIYEARALEEDPSNQAAVIDSVTLVHRHRAQLFLFRHDGPVRSVAFSPNGKRVVTACDDKTARVWDATTGKSVGAPMRHEEHVKSAVFSPDGTRVVTASKDRTARVWDAATGKPLGEPMRHEGAVWSAAFSPDGTRVVTGSTDKTARMWEAATGRLLGKPMQHEESVWSTAFSPDGTRLATASADKTAAVWDASTGKPLWEEIRSESPVSSTAFSANSMRVVTVNDDNTVQVWDATTGVPIGKPMRHGSEVRSAAFSPDGSRVVTASGDPRGNPRTVGELRLWDASSGMPLGEPMRQENGVLCALFSPDGAHLLTASYDKTARVWDVATGKPLGVPMRHGSDVESAAFSPDGMRIVTASFGETAHVWTVATCRPLGEMRHDSWVHSATFSPDSTRVVTASDDKTARMWDAATGKPLGGPMLHEYEVVSAAFNRDGTRVITVSGSILAGTGVARIWDIAVRAPAGSAFLAQLDQLTANRKLALGGFAEPLPDWMALHDDLKRQAESTAATQPSARWMTWFLADHRHRTISPFSTLTVDEWIENRLEENTADGMQCVWEIDPNNACCLARRARMVIGEIPGEYAAAVPIYVELYSKRAAELAPKDAEVLWRRAAMLAWLGRAGEAAKAAGQCPAPEKEDLWAWGAKWEACVLMKRDADAENALAMARELVKPRIKYIRDSLEQNVKEFQALPARGAATRPATLPSENRCGEI